MISEFRLKIDAVINSVINPVMNGKIVKGLIKKSYKIFMCMMLTISLVISSSSFYGAVLADTLSCRNITILVDGLPVTVRAVDVEYGNNSYVSMRDMATIVKDTDKRFSVSVDSKINIYTGISQESLSDLAGFSEDEKSGFSGSKLAANEMVVNEENRRYYTVRASYGGVTDCFMSIIDFAMLFNCGLSSNDQGQIVVSTADIMNVDPNRLEAEGMFNGLSSVLVGDATTGQIYYAYNGDNPYPIASITKIMTYLLTMDAISSGSITANDFVTVTEEADKLSKSADGTIPMNAGSSVSVSDLIIGALLPSSNECALLLANHVAGDENTFVRMMNDKAAELSLDTAVFRNSNGLPSFDSSGLSAKRQNMMSSKDMFTLASHIMNTYPEVKNITSMKMASLGSIGTQVNNTNGLLYNIPEVNGLKTGTTDKSGACLVTSLTINDGSMNHDIIVVELGAENSLTRIRISEILARYGMNVVRGKSSASYNGETLFSAEGEAEPEVTAESIVKKVVNYAISKNK